MAAQSARAQKACTANDVTAFMEALQTYGFEEEEQEIHYVHTASKGL